MRRNKKWFQKWIAICLILAMQVTVPDLFGGKVYADTTQTRTESIGIYGTYQWGNEKTIEVEVGQKVELGKYTYIQSDGTEYTMDQVGASWKNSNTAVAAITSKGVMTVKKQGKTNISIQYTREENNITYIYETKIKVTAVAKGKNTNSVSAKQMQVALDRVKKNYVSDISAKNRSVLADALLRADIVETKGKGGKRYVSASGFIFEKTKDGYYAVTDKLVLPNGCYYCSANEKMNDYVWQNATGKWAKLNRISATGKKMSVTFEKNVTNDQIFYVKYRYEKNMENKTVAYMPVHVKNESNCHIYAGVMKLTKGSKNATVTMRNMKFVKGKKYTFYGESDYGFASDWPYMKTFTAN